MSDGEQRESEGMADRIQGLLTWAVAILAVVVIVALVIFLVTDLGPFGDAEPGS